MARAISLAMVFVVSFRSAGGERLGKQFHHILNNDTSALEEPHFADQEGQLRLRNTNWCLHADGGHLRRVPITLWDCPAITQDWFEMTHIGQLRLKNTNWCLHADGGHQRRVPITLWDCPAITQDVFERTHIGQLRLRNTNWCLHADGGHKRRMRVVLWDCGIIKEDVFEYYPPTVWKVVGGWELFKTVPGTLSVATKVGITKSSEYSQSEEWSNSVSKSITSGLTAGVEIEGIGLGVSHDETETREMSQSMASQFSNAVSVAQEHTQTMTFYREHGRWIWQWTLHIFAGSDEIITKTEMFAQTDGNDKPKCFPGKDIRDTYYQECREGFKIL